MNKFHYIYCIYNNLNGKFYIGRRSTNKYPNIDSYFGSGWALKTAILKHGKKNFTKEVLEICDDFEALCKREVYWISYFEATKKGYNIVENSGGGYINKETYDIMSEKFKGRKLDLPEETLEKIRNGFKGKTHKKESKEQIRESVKKTYENPEVRKKCGHPGEQNPFYGKTHSEETKNKMRKLKSEEHKKKWLEL